MMSPGSLSTLDICRLISSTRLYEITDLNIYICNVQDHLNLLIALEVVPDLAGGGEAEEGGATLALHPAALLPPL